MIREVEYKGTVIKYNLTRKRVKNINLRVKPDCIVEVSADSRVSQKYLDSFVVNKGAFILKAFEDFKAKKACVPKARFSDEDFRTYALGSFESRYQMFKKYNIDKPQLKFRKMKSRWGSCNYVKHIITLSTKLIYCSKEQIDYVIIHEFSHLIIANHSKDFYNIVSEFCPDYKRIKKEMAGILI